MSKIIKCLVYHRRVGTFGRRVLDTFLREKKSTMSECVGVDIGTQTHFNGVSLWGDLDQDQ